MFFRCEGLKTDVWETLAKFYIFQCTKEEIIRPLRLLQLPTIPMQWQEEIFMDFIIRPKTIGKDTVKNMPFLWQVPALNSTKQQKCYGLLKLIASSRYASLTDNFWQDIFYHEAPFAMFSAYSLTQES